MIRTKIDLKRFISNDNVFYKESLDKKSRFFTKLEHEHNYFINEYLKCLRKEEYYINANNNSFLKKIMIIFWERKRNNIGNKFGFFIEPNSCGEGLTLFHQNVLIWTSKIGKNCSFHGNNCVGNNGKSSDAPVLGNNVDVGFGAVIIGNVTIADNIKIGANAVVNKSFLEPGITIAGVPAKKVK